MNRYVHDVGAHLHRCTGLLAMSSYLREAGRSAFTRLRARTRWIAVGTAAGNQFAAEEVPRGVGGGVTGAGLLPL